MSDDRKLILACSSPQHSALSYTITMIAKSVLGVIWIGFVGYTLWLAPLDQPETLAIVQKLLTFQLSDLNSYLVAIFWLMGVWPTIYACLMFADGKTQRFAAWPYFLGANGTGVICLLPYLLLRQPNQHFSEPKDDWLKNFDSPWMGVCLSGITLGLLIYAGLTGDWPAFVDEWQTIPFIHLISLDFCLMCLVFPLSLLWQDDMARRGLDHPGIFWLVALVPLLGPLAYLCLRPPLPDNQ